MNKVPAKKGVKRLPKSKTPASKKSTVKNNGANLGEPKEWTLMFYFASDNALAPSIVSQLSAIKQAGFHPNVNVIVQFDPRPEGTPTHIFDINLIEKLKAPATCKIGLDVNDADAKSAMEDKLWSTQVDRNGTPVRDRIKEVLTKANSSIVYDPPKPLEPVNKSGRLLLGKLREPDPQVSLESFLTFCHQEYRARHYMLFLVGHGGIVGNDLFLFDENANMRPSLKLAELSGILSRFKNYAHGSKLELISFHSCSMSSLEVAYQIRDSASYMLASEGPAFVGSWPYRQILMRIFGDTPIVSNPTDDHASDLKIKDTVESVFECSLQHSSNFLLAGYSFDLSLCDLKRIGTVKKAVDELATELYVVLENGNEQMQKLVADLILLAHLKSQGYWDNSYTDICDFSMCLATQCAALASAAFTNGGEKASIVGKIKTKCDQVKNSLQADAHKAIVRSGFSGPEYQYSHGLSLYFPWRSPSAESQTLAEYSKYKFSRVQKDTGLNTWLMFLEKYFALTMRSTRSEEEQAAHPNLYAKKEINPSDALLEDIASLAYNEEGQLSNVERLGGGKVNATDRSGDDCTCTSIKNFPRDTRVRQQRLSIANKRPVSGSRNSRIGLVKSRT